MRDTKTLLDNLKDGIEKYKKETGEDLFAVTIPVVDIMPKLERLVELESRVNEGWIPCSERLPRDLETVIVTWINRNPPSYYKDIKDKPFSDVAYRYDGRWYWWSTNGIEAIKEYGRYELDMVNDGIDIIAWMHMPEPFQE